MLSHIIRQANLWGGVQPGPHCISIPRRISSLHTACSFTWFWEPPDLPLQRKRPARSRPARSLARTPAARRPPHAREFKSTSNTQITATNTHREPAARNAHTPAGSPPHTTHTRPPPPRRSSLDRARTAPPRHRPPHSRRLRPHRVDRSPHPAGWSTHPDDSDPRPR